jgi:hypothetical protein
MWWRTLSATAVGIALTWATVITSAPGAFGQAVSGTLLGTITDSSGGTIARARVLATELNTGAAHASQTNESGNYTFPDLPPGRYSVTVETSGFKKEIRSGIQLDVNTSQRVDLQLLPGSVSESIEVKETELALETDRADVGRKVDTISVEGLPLGVNRNFQNLLNLVPGTTPATFQHSQFFNAESSLQTEVNGQPRQGNSYQIEGVDDDERTGLLQILIPPAEAIQTVDITTSNFEAELGRAIGAVTNVILKSGTNSFHGGAYEFLQNSDLNARSFFNSSVGHLAYNYVGGNFGGPIRRNKLFFFGDYLRTMDHEANTNLETIPTLASRTGDLSAATTVIYDPATGNADGTGRTPFASNQIPARRINPVSAKILALLPAPNQNLGQAAPSNNYFAQLPFQKITDNLDYKMDYNMSASDRLSGRFSFSRPVSYQAPIFGSAGGPAQGAFEGTGIQKTYSSGINYSRVFSPTFLAEFRVGVAHTHNEAHQADYGSNDSSALGIPGINLNPATSGIVTINLGNFSGPLLGYSAAMPWVRAEANIDFVNAWTKVAGNHTIKFGTDLRRIRDDLFATNNQSLRGSVNFAENQTSIPGANTGWGNDMASLLLDVPSQVGRDTLTYFPAYRQWWFFVFAGDKWQVTPKLTVDLGLRWEFYPPAVPAFNGGFSNYVPGTNTLVIAGVGGNPSNLGMETRYTYFAPRIGVAYRLTDKTVIRAGFGLSYTPFPDNTYAYNTPILGYNIYTPAGTGYGPALLPGGSPATFQLGIPAPIAPSVPSNGILVGTNTQQYDFVNLAYKNPHVESWNLAVQRTLPYQFTLDVAYVGNHGVDVGSQANINAGVVPGLGTLGQPEYPRTAATLIFFQGFSTSYNALQVKLDKRYSNGLLITTAFSWSKAMDFQSGDDGGLTFYINGGRNYARADFDRTLGFVQSYLYQLPIGPGKRWLTSGPASRILGGWGVSGILTLESGIPLTFTANGGTLAAPGNTQTPNQIAPIQILHGINVGHAWFSQASFAQPTGTSFGNLGRNVISGPGYFQLQLSLSKDVKINERFNVQLRAESFNLTNTPQFANPTVSLTSQTFGYVTSTVGSGTGVNGVGGGRVVQLGTRVTF